MTNLNCPSCGAVMSLDVCLEHAELKGAYAEMLKLTMPLSAQVFKYVGFFRPARNKMSPARFAKIATEVITDINAQSIQYNGREWSAPLAVWRAAFEAVQGRVDSGKLELPLNNHNYLYRIIADLADKAEALQEQEQEEERRRSTSKRRATAQGFTEASQVIEATQYHPPDPELQKIKNTKADPMPESVKKQLEKLKKGN